ncbi:hypothetical protein FNH22_01555 [Fulvivirga sp. M361]|uniref:metallophosphoesterase family protein n=1 Tax=Fulvivirga sp. M361 TaxID=2594266 RepID=UPI00117A2D18|nr:metallophosphoesterase [Fulvivirga sp. M361]TRX62036.1 hypothetical protein FNH22_01555 [Fulvivirga sp. M361]
MINSMTVFKKGSDSLIRNCRRWFLLTIGILFLGCTPQEKQKESEKTWTFVSVPDFLNKDARYPHPGFEEAFSYFLDAVKAENPDFILVPGDLVDGRWPSILEPTEESILKNAAIFYPAWKARMEAKGLKYYVSVGDHEVGDNPWPEEKAKLVPLLEEQFRNYMRMPMNGPDHMKGLAYSFIHNNTLFVSVDVFEPGQGAEGHIVAQVSGKQLEWLGNVLAEKKEVDHVIVMGHTPILAPVNKLNSSGMMLEKGRESDLWKTLTKHNVDLYLCGEVHAITCTEEDDVQQVAHGSLFGWNPTVNYLVAKVSSDQIQLALKEIDIIPRVENRKSLAAIISPEAMEKGFRTIGTMTVDKSGKQTEKLKTGCFIESDGK